SAAFAYANCITLFPDAFSSGPRRSWFVIAAERPCDAARTDLDSNTRRLSGIALARAPHRPHMSDLTRKQLEVLAFIRRFMERDGLPPTRGEIAEGLGLRNRQGIDQHLRALQSKGVIELVPGISRGIRLKEEFSSAPTPPAGTALRSKRTPLDPPGLPLLGRIAAGAPILAAS